MQGTKEMDEKEGENNERWSESWLIQFILCPSHHVIIWAWGGQQ